MTQNGRLSVVNPATEESIEEIPTTDSGELDETAERAKRGFEEWRGVAGGGRAGGVLASSARRRGAGRGGREGDARRRGVAGLRGAGQGRGLSRDLREAARPRRRACRDHD